MAPASRPFLRLALGALAWLVLALSNPAAAQVPARESAVKAAFLYKFGGFVEWPAAALPRADSPLVIGVSGDDEVAADLEQLATGRSVEGRPLLVRRLADAGPFPGVHILFLGTRREVRLREAIDAAAGPVLVVTDQPAGLRAGAVLNFVEDVGRIRFAASLRAAEARGLKLSSRLLAVATFVEGRPR